MALNKIQAIGADEDDGGEDEDTVVKVRTCTCIYACVCTCTSVGRAIGSMCTCLCGPCHRLYVHMFVWALP